ncbi:helix-turn-helix domain-containing protein [Flagellimonas sp. S174]|uniref:helix-turn-helix domain-containing protein n=1 Tax=Flagellimonas sp. S174 TaxID=3410790 RepID=UPI003BF4EB45
MKRDFKGVFIPREIWLNKEIKGNAKLILMEINSLDGNLGCFANNQHFSEMFGISKSYVSELINDLKSRGLNRGKHGKKGRCPTACHNHDYPLRYSEPPFGGANGPFGIPNPPFGIPNPPI